MLISKNVLDYCYQEVTLPTQVTAYDYYCKNRTYQLDGSIWIVDVRDNMYVVTMKYGTLRMLVNPKDVEPYIHEIYTRQGKLKVS